MPLLGSPKTYVKSGQLTVHIQLSNPQKGVWDSKGQKVLAKAPRRKTYGFGTTATSHVTIGTGADP